MSIFIIKISFFKYFLYSNSDYYKIVSIEFHKIYFLQIQSEIMHSVNFLCVCAMAEKNCFKKTKFFFYICGAVLLLLCFQVLVFFAVQVDHFR